MPSATGEPGASEPMRAWKFLDVGRIAPFGGHVWPAPSGSAPGAWIRFPGREVFACRIDDLPWWIAPELWEVELERPLRALETQVAAPAGRLLRRVTSWDEPALRAYGDACAERARTLAVDALEREGRAGDAESLRAPRSMLELCRAARALAVDAAERTSSNLAGYAAESAMRAAEGVAAASANITANAAIIASGDPAAFHRERTWQSRWIAERCGLAPLAALAV